MSQKYPGGFITKSPVAPTTAAAKGIWTLDQVTGYVKQGIWPATPGAPTIGTATAGGAGSGTATVTYTAPTDLGTGSITYTATSSPGGLTGTGASPITVSGLTGGTAYTFTVRAATPGGTGPASAASNSVTPAVLAIGDAYQGGFYTGQIGVSGVATHNLVVSPLSSGEATRAWKSPTSATAGADSVIDGPANSTFMNSSTFPAAFFCEGLTIGGYSDWYMPAKNELEVCYYNLKPTTASNNTSSGTNTNAVPQRNSNYTSGNPAQTSAAAFQSPSGAERFASDFYWSSTRFDSYTAWAQQFINGNQYGYGFSVGSSNKVRAIRRVAV